MSQGFCIVTTSNIWGAYIEIARTVYAHNEHMLVDFQADSFVIHSVKANLT